MPFDVSRDFTNWLPACAYEPCLMRMYNCQNQHQYKQYLQANADRVMSDLQTPVFCPPS